MSTGLALVLGVIGGVALAAFLMQGNACCTALGKAGLSKYGLPDLGTGADAFVGGLASTFNLV